MKLLSSLGFILVTGLYYYIGYIKYQRITAHMGESVTDPLLTFVFDCAAIALAFGAFWILTSVFPSYLILLLAFALLLARMIHYLIGAIAGFALPEKSKKIAMLFLMQGFENGLEKGLGRQSPIGDLVILAIYLASILFCYITSLWIFWKYPVGAPEAKLLITLCQLILPALIATVFGVLTIWQNITSEYLDDDLRNYYLSSGFSTVLYSTIFLLFPFWIFKQEITVAFGSLPPYWLLISVPLLLFLIGFVFPFFVGMQLFRHQARSMLERRQNWLNMTWQLVQQPSGEIRSHGLGKVLTQLKQEREKYLSDNALFKFYVYIATGYNEKNVDLPPDDVVADALAAIESDSEIGPVRRMQELKSEMKSPVTNQAIAQLWKNRAQLFEWDLRFDHVSKLNVMYELASQGESNDIKDSIKAAIDDEEQHSAKLAERKNILAGLSMSVISGVAIWLFKVFEPQIISLIGKLV